MSADNETIEKFLREAHSLSVEGWMSYTSRWEGDMKELVRAIRGIPYESRLKTAERCKKISSPEGVVKVDPVAAALYSLPDEVLDRVIASYKLSES